MLLRLRDGAGDRLTEVRQVAVRARQPGSAVMARLMRAEQGMVLARSRSGECVMMQDASLGSWPAQAGLIRGDRRVGDEHSRRERGHMVEKPIW